VASQLPVPSGGTAPAEDYSSAVMDENGMLLSIIATVAVIEAPIDELTATASGELSIRVATISDNDSVQSDDFLERTASQWTKISLQESSQAFRGNAGEDHP